MNCVGNNYMGSVLDSELIEICVKYLGSVLDLDFKLNFRF